METSKGARRDARRPLRMQGFAQHDGAARAGDPGKVARQPVQGAVGKDGEGDRLFGVNRQAVPVGEFDGNLRAAIPPSVLRA